MRRRLVFLASIAVMAGVGSAIWVLRPGPVPPPAGPQLALPVLAANYRAADRIELVQGADVLWLERRGQVWGLSQAAGYPVRADKAAALIDGLMALTFAHAVYGSPEALGVADPTASAGAGTLVRVLAVSGAVLGAVILGPGTGPAYVRRPGLPTIWLATAHVPASVEPTSWIDPALPPPDASHLRVVRSTPPAEEARVLQALAGLRFTAVRAAPQVHPVPLRSVELALADGTAVLAVGRFEGQEWLEMSGSSAWAKRLAPYAFAVPDGSLPGDMR